MIDVNLHYGSIDASGSWYGMVADVNVQVELQIDVVMGNHNYNATFLFNLAPYKSISTYWT